MNSNFFLESIAAASQPLVCVTCGNSVSTYSAFHILSFRARSSNRYTVVDGNAGTTTYGLAIEIGEVQCDGCHIQERSAVKQVVETYKGRKFDL